MWSETVEQRPEAPMSNHEHVQTAVQTHGIHRYREEGWVDLWNIIKTRAERIWAEPRTLTPKFSLWGLNWCYHANAKALNGKRKGGASSQTAADKGRGISGLTLFWWLCQGQTSDSDKKRQRSNEGEVLFFFLMLLSFVWIRSSLYTLCLQLHFPLGEVILVLPWRKSIFNVSEEV